jgi:hypothetical protein
MRMSPTRFIQEVGNQEEDSSIVIIIHKSNGTCSAQVHVEKEHKEAALDALEHAKNLVLKEE